MSHSDVGTERYFDRVRRIPLLDREQEHQLAVRAATGDAEARRALIEGNLRFVVSVALKFRRYGVRLADLVSEGNVGLMIAADKFDPTRETRFVTYAGYWIRATILDLIVRSASLVGGGSGALRTKLYFRLRRERARVENLTHDPSEQRRLLSERLALPEERVEQMLQRVETKDLSLDQPQFDDGDGTLIDRLVTPGDPESWLEAESRTGRETAALQHALSTLDERERYIVEHRFFRDEEASLADLGRTLGVSRERARQLEARAKSKLRSTLSSVAYDRVA